MSSSAEFPTLKAARRVFISYAREDRGSLDEIRAGISALHHEVWIDSNLDGGQEWWDVILDQIRRCDAMILVVSPDLIDSEAAARERLYARQLGKRLIPLVVKKVSSDLLPPDIATLQFIDYTNQSPLTGAQLANALYSVPADARLPDPLPPPPAVPVSYLGDVANVLRRPVLTADEQFSIAAKLSASLRRPREHDAAVELLGMLEDRRDLYHQTAQEIERIRHEEAVRLAADGSPAAKALPEPSPAGSGAQKPRNTEQQPSGGPSPSSVPKEPGTPTVQPAGRPTQRTERVPDRPTAPPSSYPNQPSWQQPQQPWIPPNVQTGPGNAWIQGPRQGLGQFPPPPQRWALSVISLVLFIPIGAFAIYFSSQVSGRWTGGNPSGAVDASKKAQVWGWIGVGVGVLWNWYLLSYAAMYGL